MRQFQEAEIKYKEAIDGMNDKESAYAAMCDKIKQKESNYEHKLDELNLKAEQEKYICNLMSDKMNKSRNKK